MSTNLLHSYKKYKFINSYRGGYCVPFALLNVLKRMDIKSYLGLPLDRNLTYNIISEMCNTTSEGTYPDQAKKFLKHFPELVVRPVASLNTINQVLDEAHNNIFPLGGVTFIMTHVPSTHDDGTIDRVHQERHAWLLVDEPEENMFVCAGLMSRLVMVSRDYLKWYLKKDPAPYLLAVHKRD